jgi:hypothetical protein
VGRGAVRRLAQQRPVLTLGTYNPQIRPVRLQVAIPADRSFPALPFPPVEVFWYPPAVYAAGLLTWSSRPALVTYTAEKTLADLLRLERRLGRDLCLEALKNCRPIRDLPMRLAMAETDGSRPSFAEIWKS